MDDGKRNGVQTEGEGVGEEKEKSKDRQTAFGHVVRLRRVAFLALAVVMAISGSALATDGGGSASGLSAVTGSLSTVTSLVGAVFDLILGNPLLALYVAIGLVGAGIAVFRKLRRASH